MTAGRRDFRPVRPEEVETIAAIAVAAWEPVYAHRREVLGNELFHALHADWRQEKAEQVRRAAQHRPDSVYVTEIDGELVGFTTFTLDPKSGVGEIGNNAVRPENQGQGIGAFQHRQVLELMRRRGMRFAKVTTGTDPAHAPARRSYEKIGFGRPLGSVTYFMDLTCDASAGD